MGCHSCGGPSAEACQVDFCSSVSEPVVDEAVAEHVGVEVDACLFASESDDASDAAVGEGAESSDPEAVGVGGADA